MTSSIQHQLYTAVLEGALAFFNFLSVSWFYASVFLVMYFELLRCFPKNIPHMLKNFNVPLTQLFSQLIFASVTNFDHPLMLFCRKNFGHYFDLCAVCPLKPIITPLALPVTQLSWQRTPKTKWISVNLLKTRVMLSMLTAK